MTKKEIYEQVVRLTSEVAQTKIAEKIFGAAANGEASRVEMIFDVFSLYYPDLYERIIDFGNNFNKLIGRTDEELEEFTNCFVSPSSKLMYDLATSKVIGQINEAYHTGDVSKVFEVIDNFKREHSVLAEDFVEYDKKLNEFLDNHPNGDEGLIFGVETDEANEVFAFDADIIILTRIPEAYFFYDEVIEVYGEKDTRPADHNFLVALQQATSQSFVRFVTNYDLVDFIAKDDGTLPIGDLLVAAISGDFDFLDE